MISKFQHDGNDLFQWGTEYAAAALLTVSYMATLAVDGISHALLFRVGRWSVLQNSQSQSLSLSVGDVPSLMRKIWIDIACLIPLIHPSPHFCEISALLLSSGSDLGRDAFSHSLLAPWQYIRDVLQFTEFGMTLLGSIILLNLVWKGSWMACTTIVGLLVTAQLVNTSIFPPDAPMALLLSIIEMGGNPSEIIMDHRRCKYTPTSRF